MRMARKLGRLTTKTMRKGYYKGTGSGSMGSHTKHGGYIIDYNKVRHYVVPKELQDFKLTPFVTNRLEPTRGSFHHLPKGMTHRSGEYYLQKWEEGGANI